MQWKSHQQREKHREIYLDWNVAILYNGSFWRVKYYYVVSLFGYGVHHVSNCELIKFLDPLQERKHLQKPGHKESSERKQFPVINEKYFRQTNLFAKASRRSFGFSFGLSEVGGVMFCKITITEHSIFLITVIFPVYCSQLVLHGNN